MSDDDHGSPSPRALREKWMPEVYARELEYEERLVVELMKRSEVSSSTPAAPRPCSAPHFPALSSRRRTAVRAERDHVQASQAGQAHRDERGPRAASRHQREPVLPRLLHVSDRTGEAHTALPTPILAPTNTHRSPTARRARRCRR